MRLQNYSKGRGLLTLKNQSLYMHLVDCEMGEVAQLSCNYGQLLNKASKTLTEATSRLWLVAAATESLEISHIFYYGLKRRMCF